MIADIFKFLGALPELLSLMKNMITWLKKVSGNDVQGFIVKTGDAFGLLAQAKTDEEHLNAAKTLADLIRSIPR